MADDRLCPFYVGPGNRAVEWLQHDFWLGSTVVMDQDIKDTIAGAVLYATLIITMPVALVSAIIWSGYEWMKTRN